MLCFSGFELYSRWVPLNGKFKIQCFGRQYTVFFFRLKKKTWFELSRVNYMEMI